MAWLLRDLGVKGTRTRKNPENDSSLGKQRRDFGNGEGNIREESKIGLKMGS